MNNAQILLIVVSVMALILATITVFYLAIYKSDEESEAEEFRIDEKLFEPDIKEYSAREEVFKSEEEFESDDAELAAHEEEFVSGKKAFAAGEDSKKIISGEAS